MMADSSYLASTHLPEIGIQVLHYKTYLIKTNNNMTFNLCYNINNKSFQVNQKAILLMIKNINIKVINNIDMIISSPGMLYGR